MGGGGLYAVQGKVTDSVFLFEGSFTLLCENMTYSTCFFCATSFYDTFLKGLNRRGNSIFPDMVGSWNTKGKKQRLAFNAISY